MKRQRSTGREENSPLLRELKAQCDQGKISRREFIRYAALIGVSAGAALNLAGIGGVKKAFAAPIQRGGTLRVASPIHKMTHPAQISSIGPSNMLRQVTEYLTYTDNQGITHPYLLQDWQASQDLKTWTLNLRQDITFNNGDELVADDVVFTMQQWLSKDIGSSLRGMVGSYLDSSGIEKTSRYQVVLHLKRPEIGIPEHLFHYPAYILNHRTFEGDFLRKPHGTGPYTLDTYREGEICVVKRRKDYWQKGSDG